MAQRTIDSRLDFLSPLALVPGIGLKRAEAFADAGINSIGDLLYYFPRSYTDRSIILPISDVSRHVGQICTVIGTIERARIEPGRRSRFRVLVADASGTLELLWFHGIQFHRKGLHSGGKILVTGKICVFGHPQMVHPSVEPLSADASLPEMLYVPQYPLTGSMREAGIQHRAILKAVSWIFSNLNHYPQVLPPVLEQKKNFPPLEECLHQLHIPSDLERLETYRARIKYEELYKLALTLRWSRRSFAQPGRAMSPGDLPDRFRATLAFRLTDDQEQALALLYADAASTRRMHRLLQGDVGSGKTLVAFFACMAALQSGHQVAWLSPTEVLARQTFRLVEAWLATIGFRAGLLKGGMIAGERALLLKELVSGRMQFLVGTHALLQPQVAFKSLGMIVIDEQQRFGAEQRLRLQEKGPAADFLLMSATPIPQTLAQTLYGDLNVATIAHAPAGRQPIATHIVPSAKRSDMEVFIAGQIRAGARVYYVVPRIGNDDEETGSERMRDAVTVFAELTKGPFAGISAELLHGRLSSEEKESVMENFASGKTMLMVATTVIEVGIDVPEATIIVIENAESYGLSQLHQLRGRVGRGERKSYCFLLPQTDTSGPAIQRLRALCRYHDGFKLADMDLECRGPGEVVGYRQSGWDDLLMADIIRDAAIFREIQQELDRLLPKGS